MSQAPLLSVEAPASVATAAQAESLLEYQIEELTRESTKRHFKYRVAWWLNTFLGCLSTAINALIMEYQMVTPKTGQADLVCGLATANMLLKGLQAHLGLDSRTEILKKELDTAKKLHVDCKSSLVKACSGMLMPQELASVEARFDELFGAKEEKTIEPKAPVPMTPAASAPRDAGSAAVGSTMSACKPLLKHYARELECASAALRWKYWVYWLAGLVFTVSTLAMNSFLMVGSATMGMATMGMSTNTLGFLNVLLNALSSYFKVDASTETLKNGLVAIQVLELDLKTSMIKASSAALSRKKLDDVGAQFTKVLEPVAGFLPFQRLLAVGGDSDSDSDDAKLLVG